MVTYLKLTCNQVPMFFWQNQLCLLVSSLFCQGFNFDFRVLSPRLTSAAHQAGAYPRTVGAGLH